MHAATALDCGPESAYAYDANGPTITRPWQGSTQTLSYDAENRLVGVSGPVTATLAYDGQGNRVIRQMAGETRVYLEDWFETDTSFNYTCYYYFGGQRVAQRTPSGTTYLHADHLGSTAETTGQATSEQLYYPYGAQRTAAQVSANYRYTGQRWESAIGLYDYKARWYDPALGRFIQPDSIVPDPANPQALNRYSYVYNNPVKHTDSTGHSIDDILEWLKQSARDAWNSLKNSPVLHPGGYAGGGRGTTGDDKPVPTPPPAAAEGAQTQPPPPASPSGTTGSTATTGQSAPPESSQSGSQSSQTRPPLPYTRITGKLPEQGDPMSATTSFSPKGTPNRTRFFDNQGRQLADVDWSGHGGEPGHWHYRQDPADPQLGHGAGPSHQFPPGWSPAQWGLPPDWYMSQIW